MKHSDRTALLDRFHSIKTSVPEQRFCRYMQFKKDLLLMHRDKPCIEIIRLMDAIDREVWR